MFGAAQNDNHTYVLIYLTTWDILYTVFEEMNGQKKIPDKANHYVLHLLWTLQHESKVASTPSHLFFNKQCKRKWGDFFLSADK